MAFNTYFYIIFICTSTTFLKLKAQTELDSIKVTSESLNSFALNLLTETTEIAGDSLNVALSPYTVWTLLLIILEGARGNTQKQLESVLKVTGDKNLFRKTYKSLSKYLMQNTDQVQLDISNAVFTTTDQPLNRTFQQLTQSTYGVDITPTNFNDRNKAADLINSYVANATKNRIQQFVTINDLIDAEIFLTSALYLKGQWKLPFNKTATLKEPFFDKDGNKQGDVMMMFQTGPFAYAQISSLKSHAIELDYGKGDKMSMIVLLPQKGETLLSTLKLLSGVSFGNLLKSLEDAQKDYVGDEIKVFLPKFNILSDFNLNIVLEKMGVKDMFNSELANLLGIFPHYLYVSRIIQKAQIEVNEEGTVAASASGGSLVDRIFPPTFQANKPFIYFIINKETKSIVFAGKVSNPNGL